MISWPKAETEVAAPVVAWLRAAGWDVYQEVREGRGGRSCDIVASRGPLLWAVEVKTRLNAEVIEQAHYWQQYAHYASVAAPHSAGQVKAVLELALCEWGVGVLLVRQPSRYLEEAQQVAHERKPTLYRHALATRLRKMLCEEQRDYLLAGSACGVGWSPYKATCRNLAELVRQHPGCTLREAIVGRKPTIGDVGWPGITHHYHTDSTALSSLRVWIERGKVPGVRLEKDGRVLRLYPIEERVVSNG